VARPKSQDKRNAILGAATRLFAERGLAAADAVRLEKERAEQIGATLTISSEPGKGTKIIAVSPNKVETASS
jgi:signal transduction histidine kinase